MKALFLGLQAFREDVIGHHVTAMCDNLTVVAYVNKQEGTVSRALCLLTRVVSPPSGGEVTASCLGQSVDRPLCDVPQRETAPVLLASPGSPGRLPGCVSSSLGRPGPVRVPSLSSGRSGDCPCPRVVACRDDSGHASLAREGVVRRLAASADPTTSSPALVGQPASAAPLRSLPPRRPRIEPSLVATLKRHFRKSGFSGRAASSLVRGPPGVLLSIVPVEMEDLLWLVSWKGRCSSQRHCSSSRGLFDSLTPGQGLVRLCG